MRKPINLFGLGFQGKSPNVTANRLINCYYEFAKIDADRTKVSIHGTPGLRRALNAGVSPWRGLISMPGTNRYYGVAYNVFYEVDNVGNLTPHGTIDSLSGRIGITTDGTQILVVDGQKGYGYDTSVPATPIAQITDPNFTPNPNTCTFQGGRFIVDEGGSGRFHGSDPYDVFTWPALNVATAESNPDFLVRVENHSGTLCLFGETSCEFWQNVGGSGFPYAHMQGSDASFGLAARWSLAPFMGSFAFLAKNREGQVTIAMLDGISAVRISNFELDNEINSYSSLSDATGIGFMLGGHPMYQINFPSAGKSWMYDGSTHYWSELQSNGGRHRANIGIEFLNKTIVTDYADGRIYRLDNTLHTDDGDTQRMVVRGRHIYMPGDTWFRLDRLELRAENGVGTAAAPNPQAMLRVSKDGGHTFGVERFAPLGAEGAYSTRTIWRRLGRARDIVPEISISDPVKRVLISAVLVATPGLS
jgi:hypothetical protein